MEDRACTTFLGGGGVKYTIRADRRALRLTYVIYVNLFLLSAMRLLDGRTDVK